LPRGSNTKRWRWNKAAITPVSWSRIAHDDLEQIDMTKDLDSAAGLAIRPVADGGRFDDTSVVLHWLTVLLIIGQFTSAWLREAVDHESSLAVAILATHRTMGVLTWIVGLLRLVWRHNFAYLPPFPESMPKLQQSIAKANEYGLYALLFLQPITGLARSLFGAKPFELLVWQVPVLQPNPVIHILFGELHEFGAKALLALVGLHAGAALFHRMVLRDGVLQRMSPWTSR
jgi:superoxide oxidase